MVPMLCLALIPGEARREEARQGKREKEMQKKAERARGRIVADSGSDALLRSLDAAVVRARVQLQRAVTRFSTSG